MYDHLDLYVMAWTMLSNDRPVSGMGGVYPIGWQTIMNWCDRYCVDEIQTDRVYAAVTHIDMHYCNLHNAKLLKDSK